MIWKKGKITSFKSEHFSRFMLIFARFNYSKAELKLTQLDLIEKMTAS